MENDEFKLPGTENEDREGPRTRVVSDLFRKVLVSGVGAAFMTEEGIRSLVKELKLPKEVIGAIMAQADRTKGEVVRVVAAEVRSFLESTRMRQDVLRMLTQLRLEIRAEVGIKARDEESTLFAPEVKTKVNVKRKAGGARKASPRSASSGKKKKAE